MIFWHWLALGIVLLQVGALFGRKAQSVQLSATKVMTIIFPLHNASSADKQDAALNGQPSEQELLSGLPLLSGLHLVYLKLLQFHDLHTKPPGEMRWLSMGMYTYLL